MLSDAFSEGQARDINGEFPSNSDPYTEHYDYLSDSDLEEGTSCSEEEYTGAPESDDPELPSSPRGSDSQVPSTTLLDHPPQPSAGVSEVQIDDRSASMSLGSPNISG